MDMNDLRGGDSECALRAEGDVFRLTDRQQWTAAVRLAAKLGIERSEHRDNDEETPKEDV